MDGDASHVVFYCCCQSTSSFHMQSPNRSFILSTVVMSTYPSYANLSVSSEQSDHPPLTFLIHKVLLSTE